ncbi:MAG: hypothetical protein JNN28_04400 [Saprospiraceae bacterium]|nr:hypothetical protein [Saprospiraceae bacterium]
MKIREKKFRYPGLQPFSTEQQDLFFGRTNDTGNFLSLILLEKICVLYGRSGHGKSSLINAGIIPELENKNKKLKKFLFPINIRLNNWGAQSGQSIYEKTQFFIKQQFEANGFNNKNLEGLELPLSLWGYMKRWELPTEIAPILIFDQFEEFFSYPIEQQERFKIELAELLYADYPEFIDQNENHLSKTQLDFLSERIDVRAVFSIRSDRLSELDKLKDRLPAILHKRYELKAMDYTQAKEAIVNPAAFNSFTTEYISKPFTYSISALDTMLKELSGKNTEDERIETFQLQIVCSSLEKRIVDTGKELINKEDLPNFNTVYEDYYKGRIMDLSPSDQPLARKILEQGLLLIEDSTGESRRISRDAGELMQAFKAPQTLLDNLEKTYLIRREVNSLGSFSYEISHDTLIGAIISQKKQREEREGAIERALQEKKRRVQERKQKLRLAGAVGIAALGFGLAALAWVKSEEAKSQQRLAEQAKNEAIASQKAALDALQALQDEQKRSKAKDWENFGDSYMSLGKFKEAQENYQKAVAETPDTAVIQELKKKIERCQFKMKKHE